MKLAPGISSRESIINAASSPRTRLAICFIIFLAAFSVRLLSWHDTHLEVGKVQSSVTSDYQHIAQLLRQGGISSFFSSSSLLGNLNTLGHPPGYPIVIAQIYSVFGESNTVLQFVQMICDALAAVIIFLIVAQLFSIGAAFIAGMLAAFSPQFAWNSVLLLPDSLAVLPIMLAVYCLARAIKNPNLLLFVIAGALIGVSCWLRANAMLLTFFFATATLILFRNNKGSRYALAVICGTLLLVLPLTIRNAIVFHRFIPLSLGAGQTLLEGIADYDTTGSFNIPKTDMGIMKQEAEVFHRPDYFGTLFNPDGVEREHWRLARGFVVIRSHPIWFSGVMFRRATSMVRLERSRLISTEPPVSHPISEIESMQPAWAKTPAELLAGGMVVSPQARVSVTPDGQTLNLMGDNSKYGQQFGSPVISVKKNRDYVFAAPIKIEQGRMKISVIEADRSVIIASIVIETREDKPAQQQPIDQIQLPFVASANEEVQVVFSNEASNPPQPIVKIGALKLFELGPARFLWTRYPRLLVNGVQRIFLTVVILPLALIGLGLLIAWRRWLALTILLVVPVYYFLVQSIVHTEYRYVLAVDYFLFGLAAVTVTWIGSLVSAKAFSLSLWERARERA